MKPWEDESLAANGRPIKENFADWFANSVVRCDKGHPLVVYHGTNVDVPFFDPDRIGSNMNVDKKGFFFTNDADVACYFAAPDDRGYSEEDQWDGANIIPVYVSLQRPITLEDVLQALDTTVEDIFEDWDHVGEFFDWSRPDIMRLAEERQADGIYLSLEGYQQVVAFEPGQIKSAVGNAGLYLRDNPCLTDLQAALTLSASIKAKEIIEQQDRRSPMPA